MSLLLLLSGASKPHVAELLEAARGEGVHTIMLDGEASAHVAKS